MKFPAEHPILADTILLILSQIRQERDFLYFIAGGTLLGFYRDGDYIPDDSDIDISLLFSQESYNELPSILYPRGLIPDPHGRFENRHYWKDNMLLDINWVEPEGFYEFYGEIEHNGVIHPTPYPIEGYLAWKYGDTWRTPMKEGYTLQHEH